MVQAAEADVIGPAVAAEDPHGFLGKVLLLVENLFGQRAGFAVAELLALCLEVLHVRQQLGALLSAKYRLAVITLQEGKALLHCQQALFQRRHVLFRSRAVGLAVVHSVQPFLCGGLQLGACIGHGNQPAGFFRQVVAQRLLAQVHAEAVLGIVFKQAVRPGRAMAGNAVARVGGRCSRAAPDG